MSKKTMSPNKNKRCRDESPEREDKKSVSKKRKSGDEAEEEEKEGISKASISKMKTPSHSSAHKPAELFRKDLISAMKLADSEPLAQEDYLLIAGAWRQEWERGVQVPVNQISIPNIDTREVKEKSKLNGDFKIPKKLLHASKDDMYRQGCHELTGMSQLAEQVVRYDLDDLDVCWLQKVNEEREEMGEELIHEWTMERVIEALETQCYENMEIKKKTEEGLGIEYDEDIVCEICRSPDSEDSNEMVFCDGCDICVHQACYGIQTVPEGSWLCRTCALGIKPSCILCPKNGGAMKSTRSGTKWAHVSCAIWIPEVTIGCVEKMEPITKISQIPTSRWALVCVVCKERAGACIQCSVKACKTAFHVTCAFSNNLEMKTVLIENEKSADEAVKLKAYCPKHSKKRDRNSSESESDSPRKSLNGSPRKEMTEEEMATLRADRLLVLEEEFYTLVKVPELATTLQLEEDIIDTIFVFWKLKRKTQFNKPLLTPKTEEADLLEKQQEDSLVARMKMFVHLRQDLERVRNLSYMVSRREKMKRTFYKARENAFYGALSVLTNKSVHLSAREVDKVIKQYRDVSTPSTSVKVGKVKSRLKLENDPDDSDSIISRDGITAIEPKMKGKLSPSSVSDSDQGSVSSLPTSDKVRRTSLASGKTAKDSEPTKLMSQSCSQTDLDSDTPRPPRRRSLSLKARWYESHRKKTLAKSRALQKDIVKDDSVDSDADKHDFIDVVNDSSETLDSDKTADGPEDILSPSEVESQISSSEKTVVPTPVDKPRKRGRPCKPKPITVDATESSENSAKEVEKKEITDVKLPVEKAAKDTEVKSGKDTGVKSGKDTRLKSGKDTGEMSEKETGVRSGKDTGLKSGKEAGIKSGKETGVWSGKDTGVKSEKEEEEVKVDISETEKPKPGRGRPKGRKNKARSSVEPREDLPRTEVESPVDVREKTLVNDEQSIGTGNSGHNDMEVDPEETVVRRRTRSRVSESKQVSEAAPDTGDRQVSESSVRKSPVRSDFDNKIEEISPQTESMCIKQEPRESVERERFSPVKETRSVVAKMTEEECDEFIKTVPSAKNVSAQIRNELSNFFRTNKLAVSDRVKHRVQNHLMKGRRKRLSNGVLDRSQLRLDSFFKCQSDLSPTRSGTRSLRTSSPVPVVGLSRVLHELPPSRDRLSLDLNSQCDSHRSPNGSVSSGKVTRSGRSTPDGKMSPLHHDRSEKSRFSPSSKTSRRRIESSFSASVREKLQVYERDNKRNSRHSRETTPDSLDSGHQIHTRASPASSIGKCSEDMDLENMCDDGHKRRTRSQISSGDHSKDGSPAPKSPHRSSIRKLIS